MIENDLDKRLVELETEFKNVSKQLESIAYDMKQVLQVTSKIAIIDERQSTHRSDIDRAFSDIRKQNGNIASLEERISDANSDIQAWVNRVRGGWMVGLFLWMFIQGMLIYGAKMIIDEVRVQHDSVIALDNKVKTLEYRINGNTGR